VYAGEGGVSPEGEGSGLPEVCPEENRVQPGGDDEEDEEGEDGNVGVGVGGGEGLGERGGYC
jgi:hypothetical protein